MKRITKVTPKKAVTLIELLVVIAVIGILATIGGATYGNQRKAARNTARKQSLAGFQKGLESYYSSSKTYLVHDNCNFTDIESALKSEAGNPSRTDLTASNGCVGIYGQGWGAVTRRKDTNVNTNSHYNLRSIADVLLQKGFMQNVMTDPRTKSYTEALQNNADDYNDFLLTLCKRDFTRAYLPGDAKVYGLFANLEPTSNSEAFERDKDKAEHLCGGSGTMYGWDAVSESSGG